MKPSAIYYVRRWGKSETGEHFTVHRESERCPTGATRAQARTRAHNMSTRHPDDLVTLVRDARIIVTFRNGRAMRAAAIAQPASTMQEAAACAR